MVDHSHAAFANLRDDFVRTKTSARFQVGEIPSGMFQERSLLAKQRLDFTPQRLITLTLVVQKRAPLLRVPFQSRVVDRFDSLPARWRHDSGVVCNCIPPKL